MVREINEIDGLAGLRADWTRLWAETPGATFFQSLEWLEAYWRHYAAAQRLRVVVVERDGRPSGIVPLVVRPDRTRVGPLTLLTWPLDSWGSFYGPIGPRSAETLAEALDYLREAPRDWDALDLRWQGVPGVDVAELAQAMRGCGYQGQITQHNETAVIDLGGTWEEYLASRPKLWRRNFRAAERKLLGRMPAPTTLTPSPSPTSILPSLPTEIQVELRQNAFGRGEVAALAPTATCQLPIQYIRYRPKGAAQGDGDPRWDLYDACEQIAARSWQATANGTTLSHESVRPFLRDAHAAAAALGAVDVNVLYVDGQPAAFMYNYASHGTVYGLRLGFDPAFARASVGLVLFGMAVRDSFARGDQLFDLGIGSLDTKQPVETGRLGIYRLSHYPATSLRAQLLRVRRWWEGRQLAAK